PIKSPILIIPPKPVTIEDFLIEHLRKASIDVFPRIVQIEEDKLKLMTEAAEIKQLIAEFKLAISREKEQATYAKRRNERTEEQEHTRRINEYQLLMQMEQQKAQQVKTDIDNQNNTNLASERHQFLSNARELAFSLRSKADVTKDIKRKNKLGSRFAGEKEEVSELLLDRLLKRISDPQWDAIVRVATRTAVEESKKLAQRLEIAEAVGQLAGKMTGTTSATLLSDGYETTKEMLSNVIIGQTTRQNTNLIGSIGNETKQA
ncbi:MAG: hypothetical protein EZS28_051394, partial [Streblomastix strix]